MLEVVIVLAIAGILATVLLPEIKDYIRKKDANELVVQDNPLCRDK